MALGAGAVPRSLPRDNPATAARAAKTRHGCRIRLDGRGRRIPILITGQDKTPCAEDPPARAWSWRAPLSRHEAVLPDRLPVRR